MEDHLKVRLNSRDHQSLRTAEAVTTRVRQSLTLQDRLEPEKSILSYVDLRHQYTKNIGDISPRHSENFLKQCRKAMQEEELVKYMSNLPSYLEKGEYHQEKVLNVGVLDWSQLEKWKCNQKEISQRRSRHSLSSVNSSSHLWTEEPFVKYSNGQSCSADNQRLHRRSLQFHLIPSLAEVNSQDFRSFGENSKKSQHFKGARYSDTVSEEGKFSRTDKLFFTDFADIKLDNWEEKDSHVKINPESGSFNGKKLETKQKMKIRANTRDLKCMNKLQGQTVCAAEHDASQNSKNVLHLRDLPEGNWSQLSEPATLLDCRGAETSRCSFLQMPETSPSLVGSSVAHSCPLISEMGHRDVKWCFSDVESVNILPDSSQSVPHPAKRGLSSSRGRLSEIRSSSLASLTSTTGDPSMGSLLKPSKVAAEKPRSTSPFRRLSIGMSRISKSFNSKEESTLHLSVNSKCGKSAPENAPGPSCHISSSDIQDTNRARRSPLRRLLDPLLKPKAANNDLSAQPLRRDTVSTDAACKSSRGKADSSTRTRQAGIIKLDLASCREINIDDSSQEKKRRSSTFQAFLRVAVKNGQPLFTFAVGNERDILAATMKMVCSSKDDNYTFIYTFFAVKEVRKRNGRWINQAGKDKSHDYIPNVVAQLKVSGSQLSQSLVREFVLFSVDLRQHAEQQVSELQANDELAAIVVKVPRVIIKDTNREGHQSSKSNDCPKVRLDSTSAEQCMIGAQCRIDTTVILPSGVHSLPNKGGPSSLIQRWRSGGSCDCGGWDLGCKLRIFSNDNQHIKKSSSSKACSMSDKFELISQAGEDENRIVFSLALFKDGIYSVEFTSSLSVLQAFSLCIAVLDSKKLCETSELIEGKSKLCNETRVQSGEVDGVLPARYVSNPPHSPAGRV